MNKMMALVGLVALVACDDQESNVELLDAESLARSSKAGVQVVHLSPDAPAVDVFVNGRTALTDVPYLGASGTVRVRPGSYGLDITPAVGGDPVISADLVLETSTSYTIVAWDEVASIRPAVLVNDLAGIPAGQLRLQVTHTAVGVGTVDVWELNLGVKLVDNFPFGGTGVLDVPATALRVGLDLNEDAVPDVTFSVPNLGEGNFVNVFPVADAFGVALYAVYLDGTTARVDAD